MNLNLRANRVRLALEFTKANFPNQQMDAAHGGTPRAPHGRVWDVEVAIFNAGSLLTSIGAVFTSLTFELKAAANGIIDAASATLLSATVNAANFNTALTAADWSSDSGFHAAFQFTDTQTATLNMTAAVSNELQFGWVVTGLTSTGRVTVGSGLVTVVKDGGTGAGGGSAPVPTYTISDQEILAGLASKVSLGENPAGAVIILRTQTGRGLVIRAVDDGASARADFYAIP